MEHVGRKFEARLDHRESAFDLCVAHAELCRVKIEEGQGLCKDKQVLLTPGAGQRPGDLVCILFAAVVAQGGQVLRVALARDNGTDDLLSRSARDIAEGLRQLDVHL